VELDQQLVDRAAVPEQHAVLHRCRPWRRPARRTPRWGRRARATPPSAT